jgi:hypothetical protein
LGTAVGRWPDLAAIGTGQLQFSKATATRLQGCVGLTLYVQELVVLGSGCEAEVSSRQAGVVRKIFEFPNSASLGTHLVVLSPLVDIFEALQFDSQMCGRLDDRRIRCWQLKLQIAFLKDNTCVQAKSLCDRFPSGISGSGWPLWRSWASQQAVGSFMKATFVSWVLRHNSASQNKSLAKDTTLATHS